MPDDPITVRRTDDLIRTINPCPKCGVGSERPQADGLYKCLCCGGAWRVDEIPPLPLSVAIRRELCDKFDVLTWKGDAEFSADSSEIDAIIDGRIRPLWEALQLSRTMLASVVDMRPEWIGAREALQAADAALRAAGAE